MGSEMCIRDRPDLMREMLDTKINHLEAGANCSWVPSPTAATLHSTHYHLFNVFDCQKELLSRKLETKKDDILKLPLLKSRVSPYPIFALLVEL